MDFACLREQNSSFSKLLLIVACLFPFLMQGLSEEEVRAAAACAREEVLIRNRFVEMNAPKDNSSVNK